MRTLRTLAKSQSCHREVSILLRSIFLAEESFSRGFSSLKCSLPSLVLPKRSAELEQM